MTNKTSDNRHVLSAPRLRPFIVLLLSLIVLGGAANAWSTTHSTGKESIRKLAGKTVTILMSEGHAYKEVGDRIFSDLSRVKHVEVHTRSVSELEVSENHDIPFNDADLVVAVGTGAFRYVANKHADATVLAVFVTSYSYRAVLDAAAPKQHQFFALFIDQPLDRYLRLSRLLLPDAQALSISGLQMPTAQTGTADSGSSNCRFTLESVEMSPDSNPIRVLDSYYARSDAFLVFPQSSAQDRNSAKWILYLASRHRKPVIAFSQKYVDGGALASVFAAPSDIARETHQILSQWDQTGIPPTATARTGNLFTVKTNARIARFLKLQIPSELELTQNLAKESPARGCGPDER